MAVNAVDLALEKGEILGIIGPNGAGKSTLFNLIAGLDGPTSGAVHFRGHSIAGLTPDAVCRLGIAKTFQIPQLFPRLTVPENVLVAALYGHGSSLSAAGERRTNGSTSSDSAPRRGGPRIRSPSPSAGAPTSRVFSRPARR